MNIKILTTVSAIALFAATPAVFAQTETQARQDQGAAAPQQQEEGLWEQMQDGAESAAEEVQSLAVGEGETAEVESVTIDQRKTATGMIGSPVYNEAGEEVAEISDIIIDQEGNAVLVVVSDAEFLGTGGTEAAFDYNTIVRQTPEGDVVMPLTEEMVSSAAEFSYDREAAGENVRVIPSNGYSVSELLDAELIDEQNESIAQVDNIAFEEGRAKRLIVGFNKILGMGGETAALEFEDAQIVQREEGVDFQLSANQAAQFENYKQSVSN